MADFRHPKWIDLNQNEGNSFFGLTRAQAKTLAMTLIIFSLMLMSPPGLPDITDFLNIAIAQWISGYYNISNNMALTITYTIIPWTIFLLGIWIYPARTMTVFNGYVSKLKNIIKKLFKDPLKLIILIIVGYIIFQYYSSLVGVL